MKQTIDPTFDVNWGPVLWTMGTFLGIGLVVTFLPLRADLLIAGAFLAGVVASLQSGFYDSSGNNAVLGVILGLVVLTPVMVVPQILFGYGVEGSGDILFITGAFSLAQIAIALFVFPPVAYLGAVIGNVMRKRIGGPIGYDTGNTPRRSRRG